jgi:hypothetical protein
MIPKAVHPNVLPFAQILIDGLPAPLRHTLTSKELSLVVAMLGRGVTLQRALDRIQAMRPTLPFTPEAA